MYKSPDGLWEIVIPSSSLDFTKNPLRKFTAADIQFVEGKSIDYSIDPKLEQYVENKWIRKVREDESKGRQSPKNGRLVRVSKMPFINAEGKLELHLGQTNYKEHIATNFPEDKYSSSLSYDQNANVLNSMVLLISADNYLVYTIRGETATGAGKLSGFGVALPNHEEILKAGSESLFEQVKNALYKEIGVSEQELNVQLRGFAYVHDGFHVPLWIAHSKLNKETLEEKFKETGARIKIGDSESPKYKGIGFVPLEIKDYLEFVKNPEILEWVRPLVFYFGAARFGLAQMQ